MDVKTIFGILLTLLGIGGLIYAALMFGNGTGEVKTMIVYFVLGAIFFFSGIGLLRSSKT